VYINHFGVERAALFIVDARSPAHVVPVHRLCPSLLLGLLLLCLLLLLHDGRRLDDDHRLVVRINLFNHGPKGAVTASAEGAIQRPRHGHVPQDRVGLGDAERGAEGAAAAVATHPTEVATPGEGSGKSAGSQDAVVEAAQGAAVAPAEGAASTGQAGGSPAIFAESRQGLAKALLH